MEAETKKKGEEIETELGDLPEGCIASILSFTTPVDACELALVSTTFRSAANSDAVWDNFLPSDIHSIISSSDDRSFSSTKDLFFTLCHHPILIDDAKKSFCLEKRSGKKCYMLAAKDLMIAWGSTPHYWKWINPPDSRFAEVAELQFVWWLEIRGKIDTSMLSPATTYVACLVFKLRGNAYGLDSYPTEVSIGIVGGEKDRKTVCLVADDMEQRQQGMLRTGRGNRESRVLGLKRPKRREDGWLEIELGEYFNHLGEDGELEMSVMEVNAAKSGIIVQGIEIRPNIL